MNTVYNGGMAENEGDTPDLAVRRLREHECPDPAVEKLLASAEPAVRYQALVRILGADPSSPDAANARRQVVSSPRVAALLAERDAGGRIPGRPYAKWGGAHWVLVALAELGYPPGDESLIQLREQELEWLFSAKHAQRIQTVDGRVRRCTSQEGNALYALLTLGLADERCDELAARLARWQWPDGGWNCDLRPEAIHSSFMETLIPLRALALHGRVTGNQTSLAAAARAAEPFLTRGLFRRRGDGGVIDPHFLLLHYPCYWHYDILFGLKVLAEAGFAGDARCREALDLLRAKRLPGGGYPAEARYYQSRDRSASGYSPADWGVTGTTRMNEWVTLDTLYVMRVAGSLP